MYSLEISVFRLELKRVHKTQGEKKKIIPPVNNVLVYIRSKRIRLRTSTNVILTLLRISAAGAKNICESRNHELA